MCLCGYKLCIIYVLVTVSTKIDNHNHVHKFVPTETVWCVSVDRNCAHCFEILSSEGSIKTNWNVAWWSGYRMDVLSHVRLQFYTPILWDDRLQFQVPILWNHKLLFLAFIFWDDRFQFLSPNYHNKSVLPEE